MGFAIWPTRVALNVRDVLHVTTVPHVMTSSQVLQHMCCRREGTQQQAAEAAAQRGLQHQKEHDIHAAIAAFEVCGLCCLIRAWADALCILSCHSGCIRVALRSPAFCLSPVSLLRSTYFLLQQSWRVWDMQEAAQLLPSSAHYLSLLSKQWSDITFIPGTPKAEAKSCAEKGLAIAQEVRQRASNSAQGLPTRSIDDKLFNMIFALCAAGDFDRSQLLHGKKI